MTDQLPDELSPARPAPPVREPSLLMTGLVTGVAVSFALMLAYQAVRVGWRLATDATSAGVGNVDTPERVVGVLVMGGLLSLAPAVFAGGVLGAVTGGYLQWSWRRQGLVRAWLSGTGVAYLAAVIVNLTVLGRDRRVPVSYHEWVLLLGLPSILYVIAFGGIGVYLYVRGRRAQGRPL